MEPVTIMKLGAEGGSISLVGLRTDSSWQFRIETSEASWMLDDDAYTPLCRAAALTAWRGLFAA